MSIKQEVEDVIEYNKLPKTEEKAEIDRQYLNDEIGHFDFYCKVKAYLERYKND